MLTPSVNSHHLPTFLPFLPLLKLQPLSHTPIVLTPSTLHSRSKGSALYTSMPPFYLIFAHTGHRTHTHQTPRISSTVYLCISTLISSLRQRTHQLITSTLCFQLISIAS